MAKNKKTLLEEGTVRRFMKLAEIAPLTDSFLDNQEVVQEEDESREERADVDKYEYEQGKEAGEEEGAEEELELDLGAEEAEAALPPSPETEEGEVTLTDDEVDSLVAAFDAAEGVVTKLRSAGDELEPEEVEAVDMGGEEELDVEMDMEAGPEGEEVEMEVEDEIELAEVTVVDDESLVNEVATRVAKRLLRSKQS